jgi:hypothetical protein
MIWSKAVTVEQVYGDWDQGVAVELLEQSLDPPRSLSILETAQALGIGPDPWCSTSVGGMASTP